MANFTIEGVGGKIKKNAVFAGIALILLAAGLLFLAFSESFALLTIPVWKIFLGVVLILWIVNTIKDHFGPSLIFPFAFLFLLFEKEIAALAGLNENFVNNWLVLGAAVVLYIGLKCIFRGNLSVPKSIGDKIEYFDANEDEFTVKSHVGDLNVFFQNTGNGKTSPMTLRVASSVGDATVHVPADWGVVIDVKSRIGNVSVRKNPDVPSRTLTIVCSSQIGNLSVVSD